MALALERFYIEEDNTGNVHLQPNMGIPGIPRSTGHVLRYDRCKASLVVDKRQRPAPVKDAGCLIYTEYVEGLREEDQWTTIMHRNLSTSRFYDRPDSLATRFQHTNFEEWIANRSNRSRILHRLLRYFSFFIDGPSIGMVENLGVYWLFERE